MASLSLKTFVIICLTCCFIQAQGRPGKPFYACRSYIVAISFSLGNDDAHQGGLMNEEEHLGVFKEEEFRLEDPNQVLVESWGFTNNYNPFHRTNMPYARAHDHPHHDHHKKMMSNFQRRARDVLSILIALLLGALCGAITSTIFHLVWSIATNRYASLIHQEDDVGVEPQDFGYQKLPTKEGVEHLPTKEGVEHLPIKEGVEVEAK